MASSTNKSKEKNCVDQVILIWMSCTQSHRHGYDVFMYLYIFFERCKDWLDDEWV